jgi:hypothetical protein
MYFLAGLLPEPLFVNLFSSARIDSQPCGPVRQPCLSDRAARLQRLAESMPRNRFLGSINIYKYGVLVRDRYYSVVPEVKLLIRVGTPARSS